MYVLTAEQKAELETLIAIADARPDTQQGAWSEVYEKLYEFITVVDYGAPLPGSQVPTVTTRPIEGVDHNVWLWVRGARDINAGNGPFAELIREYTAIQHEIHYGQALEETRLHVASNEIAEEFFKDVLDERPGDNDGIPDINKTGIIDASPVAAKIFGGNFSPWVSSPLYLGHF